MNSKKSGLTVVEVLVALVILAVAGAMLATTTVSSLRHDATSGGRTQAVQILNYLGRLASSSDVVLLSGEREWDYGELQTTFTELSTEARRADPNRYRAFVDELGTVGLGISTANLYRVTVCWMASEDESCVEAVTAGLPIAIGTDPDPDPVVN